MADVSVSVGATLGELRKGLDEGGKLVNDFQKKSQAAQGAARSLAAGISAIGGASSGAAGMVGNFLAGFAIGGPMGAAVAAVNLLVSSIQASGKAEAEALKKTRDAQAERRKEYLRTANELERLKFIEAGGTSEGFDARNNLQQARGEVKAAQEAAAAAQRRLDDINARREVAAQAGVPLEENAEAVAALAEAERFLAEAIRNRVAVEELGSRRVADAEEERAEKARQKAEAEKRKAEEAERRAAAAEARARALGTTPTLAPLPSSFDRPLAPVTDRGDDTGNMSAGTEDIVFGGGAFTDESQQKQYEQFMQSATDEAREFAAAQRDAEDASRELASAGAVVAQSFGAAFASVVTGSAKGADAFAAMGQQIIGLVLNLATKEIMAHAATAAAGAAKSQSGIPIVGPVLAIGAMTAMLGTVQGLLGNLPGRASGGPVTGGSPYLVGERGMELFVPPTNGTIVPNHALGRGRSGAVNVAISALDGVSVHRTLTRADHELRRSLDRMTRRRR
jgi:hypothetical protein